jgi:catalase
VVRRSATISISRPPAGDHGVLLEDFNVIEKLARFDRQRIPERIVKTSRSSGALSRVGMRRNARTPLYS